MGVLSLALWLVLSAASYELTDAIAARECGHTVVLLGSTGDLAKRYIWPALLENSINIDSADANDCEHHELLVFGVSRSPVVDREDTLTKVLVNVKCKEAHFQCLETIKNFRKSINFVHIKTPEDYEELAFKISVKYEARNMTELGRVVYLSIPPSAYVATAEHISKYLKPSGLAWLRIVLEKPFGRDLSSALALSNALGQLFSEEQVYCTDHYLGKPGVQLMSQFLEASHGLLKPIWNSDAIQLIEVAMEETVGVSGRGSFYDNNGVIRDVHQNHLTEILAILLMNPNVGHKNEKLRVLAGLFPPQLHHAVLGQYTQYRKHLEGDGLSHRSTTPTYASVMLQSRDPQWRGVTFALTSGKQLTQKRAFVRVIFKHGRLTGWTRRMSCPYEIRFVIQQDGMRPGIFLSEHFSEFELKFPDGLTKSDVLEGSCLFSYYSLKADVNSNSYIPLIKAVLDGRKEHFVDLDSLLESWRIWTPLLEEIDLSRPQPLFYSPDNLLPLEFKGHIAKTTPYTMNMDSLVQNDRFQYSTNATSGIAESNSSIVQATKYELTSLLASDLLRAAAYSVTTRGSFHLALPGGTTPLFLLGTLSLDYRQSFPWQYTHIWQTDERCVHSTSQNSNLQQLTNRLFSNVPIPYLNIHPMPVHLQQGLCYHGDSGAEFYQRQLLEIAPDSRLDYVLLGVGADGHIASLFPSNNHHGDKLVDMIYSDVSQVNKRMTLTMECIIRARNIGIVFIGENKRDILRTVTKCLTKEPEENSCCSSELPVMELIAAARKEQLTFYVDSHLV